MAPPKTATWSLQASPRTHELLQRLHAASEAQEKPFSQIFFYIKMLAGFYICKAGWSKSADDHMRDKFVSLEEDKCQFMYLLARSIGAKNIIEAGTSFGVSTLYLALAVGQNVADARAAVGTAGTGKVIATEREPTKAAKARDNWKQAGDEVEPWIELREGDLRQTLNVAEGMPEQIDMLLLDTLPILEIVKPRLRKGAIVLADNTTMAKPMYKEFLAYIQDPRNGFETTTTPFSGGLEMIVYLPSN